MTNLYDVIVVGVGAMGASACCQLARRGARVLGLEQFAIPNDLGSAHGQSRMIRMAYYEHPDYVPLLRRAYELWDELESLSGQKLLFRTGGVYAGPREGEVVAGSLGSARLHNLEHELLSADGLSARFDQFRLPPGWAALYEPTAGFLLPEKVVAAYADLARRHGAELRQNEPALTWRRDDGDGHWNIRTGSGDYRAKHLLVCGGPWSGKLLKDLNVPLVVTRQVLGWVTPQDSQRLTLGKLPVWAAENPDGTIQYGFPILPGEDTLKVAWHGAGTPTDPHAVDRHTSGADAATFVPQLPHFLPAAAGPVARMKVCLYTNSPDHHFIIGAHPRHARMTIACGFSGHGFKFASVVGEVLADLTTSGQTRWPVGFLNTSRFDTR